MGKRFGELRRRGKGRRRCFDCAQDDKSCQAGRGMVAEREVISCLLPTMKGVRWWIPGA